jgi:hypothetical protein
MYFKVNFIGEKYLYFDFFQPPNKDKYINPNGFVGSSGYEGTMVISLRRNKRFTLSKESIKKEIEKYPELYSKYKKEKQKNIVLKKYIKLLDEKSK